MTVLGFVALPVSIVMAGAWFVAQMVNCIDNAHWLVGEELVSERS